MKTRLRLLHSKLKVTKELSTKNNPSKLNNLNEYFKKFKENIQVNFW